MLPRGINCHSLNCSQTKETPSREGTWGLALTLGADTAPALEENIIEGKWTQRHKFLARDCLVPGRQWCFVALNASAPSALSSDISEVNMELSDVTGTEWGPRLLPPTRLHQDSRFHNSLSGRTPAVLSSLPQDSSQKSEFSVTNTQKHCRYQR